MAIRAGSKPSYIIFLLRPHHVNFNKRLIKMPKLYFYDVGLASWLLGIRTAEQIMTHPLRGNLFETLIIGELIKSRFNIPTSPQCGIARPDRMPLTAVFLAD